MQIIRRLIWLTVILFTVPLSLMAFSVLTHEAIIDANWDKVIVPLLKKKYPEATADQLKEAHAYVYGGAVAPDMGYYPFGNKLFTNLTHYVRSGDFVQALLNDAGTLDEFAFAIGALCHYNADEYGHSLGVNQSVALVYPKDRKFGPVVTYENDKKAHIRVEFSFDVLQTARGNYASNSYHGFIGFQVSKELLQRAFLETYGLDVNDLFGNYNRTISTFRFAVKDFIPEITRVAWQTKKNDLKKTNPGVRARQFKYHMHRVNYYREYGKDYQHPGFFAKVISIFLRIVPKIGPFSTLKFKAPTPEAEKNFVKSFDSTVFHYASDLNQLGNDKKLSLPDIDFDTGKKTAPGEYGLCDQTYSDWLIKLKDKNFDNLTVSIKQNIIDFYNNAGENLSTRKDEDKWEKTKNALEALKSVHPSKPQVSVIQN